MILFITDACLDQGWNLSVSFGFKFLENKVLSQDRVLLILWYFRETDHWFNTVTFTDMPLIWLVPWTFEFFHLVVVPSVSFLFWIVESKCGLATSPQPHFVTLSMSPFPGLLFAHLKSHFLRFLLIFGKSKLRGLGTPF